MLVSVVSSLELESRICEPGVPSTPSISLSQATPVPSCTGTDYQDQTSLPPHTHTPPSDTLLTYQIVLSSSHKVVYSNCVECVVNTL